MLYSAKYLTMFYMIFSWETHKREHKRTIQCKFMIYSELINQFKIDLCKLKISILMKESKFKLKLFCLRRFNANKKMYSTLQYSSIHQVFEKKAKSMRYFSFFMNLLCVFLRKIAINSLWMLNYLLQNLATYFFDAENGTLNLKRS